MFELNDQVRIKPEWCDDPKEADYIFTVVNVNDLTKRCIIETMLPGWSLPIRNLVNFGMIEKINN